MLSVLCPYVAVTIAERIRDRGHDAVICLDDLSRHAKSYRQLSLILGKIPSRDAYPSDIFNIHSSLLERSGKLKCSYGGGSVTAFPIIETSNCDITEYIATNVISITDGQLYLDLSLFQLGIRPAIDSALSVSRIGSAAQSRLAKLLSANLKNEYTFAITHLLSGFSQVSLNDSVSMMSLILIFLQSHIMPSPLELTLSLLIAYRSHLIFYSLFELSVFHSLFSYYLSIPYYLLFLVSTSSSSISRSFVSYVFGSSLSYFFNSNFYSLSSLTPFLSSSSNLSSISHILSLSSLPPIIPSF
jgi:hypothetical protein